MSRPWPADYFFAPLFFLPPSDFAFLPAALVAGAADALAGAALAVVALDAVALAVVAFAVVAFDGAAAALVLAGAALAVLAGAELAAADFAAVALVAVDFVAVDFAAVDFAGVALVAVALAAVVFAGALAGVDFAVALEAVDEVDFAAVAFDAVDAVDLAAVDFAGADFATVDLAGADFAAVDFAAVDWPAVDWAAVPREAVPVLFAVFAGAALVAVAVALAGVAALVARVGVPLTARDDALFVAVVRAGRVEPFRAAAAVTGADVEADTEAVGAFASFLVPVTTSLKPCPALNAGVNDFFTLTVSPVRGLRAVRAFRMRFSKVPKPVMPTRSPRATARWISSRTPSRAAVAARRSPRRCTRASISSVLFTSSPSKCASSYECAQAGRLGANVRPAFENTQ